MILNAIIATTTSEVGISWLDFYSIGHICFGIGAFMFISLLYSIPKAKGYTPIFSLLMVFISIMAIMVLWEIFENYVFFWIGWEHLKFEGRPDSLQNMSTDILLGTIGAIGAWIFAYLAFEKDKKILLYYIFGIINFSLWLCVFIILRYLTLV